MSRPFLVTVLLGMVTVLTTTVGDTPDCPYPCLPPPTSGGMINSYPPPPPATGGSGGGGFGGSYPPPPPGSYQLTPPGVMPGYFAPPNSAFPAGPAPPPPNPILPWFPWYYQHNNPITGSTTSASSPAVDRTSACMIYFERLSKNMKMYRAAAPKGHLDTCFDFRGVRSIRLPRIALMFERNAAVELDPSGILFDDCLAFAPNSDDRVPGIIGNVQQQTLEVLYDVVGETVGFRRGAC